MTRTMLPGEPLSPAQSNASAKVATIAGAYQVQQWLHETFFNPTDWSELNPEQLEFLSDWSVDREDCNRDIIDDALWRFVRYENLSAEVCSGFYPAGTEAPEPTRWRVWLTIGGPSCYLQGDFGLHGAIDDIEVVCSWAGPDQYYTPTDLEREALEWFVASLIA